VEKGFRNYIRYLYRNQLQTLGLVAGQVILLGLSFANVLSLYLSSPIVITLALIAGYVQYQRASGDKISKVLKDMGRQIADFEKFNFEERKEDEDYRIITLLDRITLPTNTDTDPWREIVSAVPEVKRLHGVFKFWHSTVKNETDVISHQGASVQSADLARTVEDFATFYNGYMDNVAERVLQLLNKPPILEQEHQIKSKLSVYRENMGHLRDRINSFLTELQELGYSLSISEVKVIRTELLSRFVWA